jgi:hypothetical protein
MGDTKEYRQQARDCLNFANAALAKGQEAFWLLLAQQWLNLAQEVEEDEAKRTRH